MKRHWPKSAGCILLSLCLSAHGAAHYVDINSAAPASPYSDWSTAATNIQDAIDVAVAGEEVVVGNGVYQTGGRVVYGKMTNRVVADKPLLVRSVNGPANTIINGKGAVRCVYLTDGAVLSGFTLTNGATRWDGDFDKEQCGGGVWCAYGAVAVVTNCLLTGNYAYMRGGGASSATLKNCALTGNTAPNAGGGANFGTLQNCTLIGNSSAVGGGTYFATLTDCTLVGNIGGGADACTLTRCILKTNSAFAYGGGASGSTLEDCMLVGNSATYQGGGSWLSTLNNCTLIGNSTTSSGGGSYGCSLNNCISYYNSAPTDPNNSGGTLNYCCTTPLPGGGVGNFTNEPLFMDISSGDLRLQPNSPCINAGQNAYVSSTTDLVGNPRIVGGRVDVGACECQPQFLQVKPLGLLVVTNLPNLDPSLRQRSINAFFYSNRYDMLADGWSFWATKPNGGGGRNTEITNTTDGAVVDYNQANHLGVLRIPCDVGDLEASANNSRNSLFRNLPANWISAQLRFSFAPTANFQQAHLGLYQDDDNYLEVGIGFNSYRVGTNLSMAFEANGAPTVTLKTNLVTAALSCLRLDRDLGSGTITGWSSLDAINWTNLGSMTLWLANPRLLIWVGAAPSPWRTGQPTADLSELDVVVSNSLPRVLTYALVNPPSGALIDNNGVITWMPTEAQAPGTYTLTSVVSDNWMPPWSVTNTFTVTVVPLPRLSAGTTGDGLVISWPASLTNFLLESALDLSPGILWTPVTNLPGSVAGEINVTIPRAGSQQFFRLRQQVP